MYFCGTDLYSYYKNNLSDVAKALSRNILPLGRIVAFTQPAASEGYVVEYRYDEAANACERDTLIRYTPLPGRTTDPAVMERILGDLPRKGMATGIDRKFVMAAQQRPSRRRSVAKDTRCGRNPLVRP